MQGYVCRLSLVVIVVCAFVTIVCAQEDDVPRFEIGAQFSSLTIQEPNGFALFGGSNGFRTEPGFGGRFTVNITPNIAAEAEIDFFPNDNGSTTNFTGGRTTQGLFGVKAGKRFERFGVFGKARPGFVRFERTITGFDLVQVHDATIPQPRFDSRSEFAIDLGGVLEFYPSRRIVTRFDIGDTLIRYKERTVNVPLFSSSPIAPIPPPTLLPVILNGETRNNFQFTAGIGFRF